MSAAAMRALLRWSVRLFRREWRQQLHIVLLVTVAVATTIVGIALVVQASPSQAAQAGDADRVVVVSSPQRVQEAVAAAARAALPVVDPVVHTEVSVPGSVRTLDVRDQDPDGALGHGMLRLVHGRYPTGADEVALTDRAASLLEVGVGDATAVEGRAHTVVGMVENPLELSDEFLLVAPGTIGRPERLALLVRVHDDDVLRRLDLGEDTRPVVQGFGTTSSSQAAGAVLAVSTVGMLFVGLLALAGFDAIEQRRLRSLGLLGAIGASPRQLRLAGTGAGAVVGLTGGVLGAGVGLAAWITVAGRLEQPFDHRIDRWATPWWAVVAACGLALLTATGAAWWPGAASGVDRRHRGVGEPTTRCAAARPAAVGAIVLGLGVAALFVAHHRTSLVVAGVLGIIVGVLLLAPIAIRTLGALADRAPLATRLALRDLDRHQGHAAAAMGAIALALGIAASVAIGTAAAQRADERAGLSGNLPDDELLVHIGTTDDLVTDVDAGTLAAAQDALASIGRSVGGTPVELRRAVAPDAPLLSTERGASGRPPASLGEVTREGPRAVNIVHRAGLYVATPEVLAFDGIDPASIDADVDVVTARRDLAGTEITAGLRQTTTPVVAQIDRPAYVSEPTTLLTLAAVQELGLQQVTVGWIVRSPKPLTSAQIDDATHAAAAAGLSVETRDRRDDGARVRTVATAVGLLIALVVVAATVGLLRAESAADLRMLAAIGAPSVTRHTIAAATAAGLGLLGGGLGTLGAYAGMLTWHHGDLAPLGDVPWRELLAVVVGLPAAAALGAWVFAGADPPERALA